MFCLIRACKNIWLYFITLLAAAVISGCQPAAQRVYLMPAPVGISTGASDPFIDTPEKEKDSNILVGYATNRMPIGAREARFYTRSFDEDLRMGVVTIQIGDGNDSWDEIRELSINDAYKGQILLTLANAREVAALGAGDSLETLSPTMAKMMGDFNQYIERSPSKEITLYVHGANNNFYRSAAQAAQYRHFTRPSIRCINVLVAVGRKHRSLWHRRQQHPADSASFLALFTPAGKAQQRTQD